MRVSKKNAITSYKAFNKDWTCHGFQYEVGKEYKFTGEIELCQKGFHSCTEPSDCFNYYPFDPKETKFAEVKIWGEVVREENSTKCCSSKIFIVRAIKWNEVLTLCNSGFCNSGCWNSGNRNSGNRNTGDMNSGYRNSGYHNSGDRNSGDTNSGDHNSGNRNSGNWNSGSWNSGYRNSGDTNSGEHNSGNRNSGRWNSGRWNTGDGNSGDGNSGDWNSGDRNSGSGNSGRWNSGKWNSGKWNSGNWNSGYFNTASQNKIFCFNKLTEKQDIDFPEFLHFSLTEWVNISDMSESEKKAHPGCEATGGYLKKYSYKDAFRRSFLEAKQQPNWKEELAKLKAIPNFDYAIFEEISGITKEELEQ